MKSMQREGFIQLRVPERGVPFSRTALIQNYSIDLAFSLGIEKRHYSFCFVIWHQNDQIHPVITLGRNSAQKLGILVVSTLKHNAVLLGVDLDLGHRGFKKSPHISRRHRKVQSLRIDRSK
jgi:hypothetical protein